MSTVSSTNNSSSTTNKTYSYSSSGLSGLISGMDTETMVKKLLAGTQTKIDRQKQQQQVLKWKQTMYQTAISDINNLKSKYFDSTYDSTLTTNLSSYKFFNTKISSVTSGSAVTVNSTDYSANVGSATFNVKQLASATTLTGSNTMSASQSITGTAIDFTALQSALSSADLTFNMSLDGVSKEITLSKKDFATADFETGGSIGATEFNTVIQQKTKNAFGTYVTANVNTTTGEGGTSSSTLTFAVNIKKSTVDDNGVVTAGTEAETGHELVITGASASKLGVTPGTSSLFSTSSTIGSLSGISGTDFSFKINGNSFSFKSTDTVASVINAVNASTSNVRLAYSSATDKFTLQSSQTGAQYGIDLTQTQGQNLLDTLFGTGYSSSITKGTDLIVSINGNQTSRSSNTFTIDGLTVTASSLSNGTDTVVGTTRDTSSVVSAIKSFVSDYNGLVSSLYGTITEDTTYKDYAPLTDAQKAEMSDSAITAWEKNAKIGLLRNDDSISTFLQSMDEAFYTQVSSAGLAAYSIGIETVSTDLSGKLKLDESALTSALSTDPDAVAKLFTDSTSGISTLVSKAIDSAAKLSAANPGSLVQIAGASGWSTNAKNNDIYNELQTISDKLDDLQDKYDDEKDRYWNKFNKMETVIANYQSQSGMLSSFTSSSSS